MHFVAGLKKGISAVKCVPGVLREKVYCPLFFKVTEGGLANAKQKGAWKSKREVKKQEMVLAKQRKLAEKMKMSAAEGEETPAAEATPAA